MRGGVALPGGAAKPLDGFLRPALSGRFLEAEAQADLGAMMPLFGREAKPLHGLVPILGHALAVGATNAHAVLRVGVSLFGRLAEPVGGLPVVLLDAPSPPSNPPPSGLGASVAAPGRPQQQGLFPLDMAWRRASWNRARAGGKIIFPRHTATSKFPPRAWSGI